MILRKFRQHIQAENWFAVSVDFLVVVVGIFVGLQVEGWYQDQKDKAAETRLVGYLITDIENTINYLEGGISFLNKNSASGRKTLTLLKNDSLINEDIDDFERGLKGVGKILSPDSFLVSFEQSSINTLMDPELKRTVRTYLATVRATNAILVHIRERMNGAMILVGKRAFIGPQNDQGPLIIYSFESLRQDNEFKTAFMSSLGMSDEASSQFKEILNISNTLLVYLKNYPKQ